MPHGARRDEGRPPGDRDAAAIVVALEIVGSDRRCRRTGRVSPLCRTRHDRRLDGPRRTASDGRVHRRRSIPPARRCGRGRRRDRREGTHPHGPGHAGGAAPCRRIHGGCQRAHGAVRDRRVERAVHSSLARRRDREGGQAAPRPPARADARFGRLGERDGVRGLGRHRRLARLRRRGIGGGESTRARGAAQPRSAGRLQSVAGPLGGRVRVVERGRGAVPAAPRLLREHRTSDRGVPERDAHELRNAGAPSGRGLCLRRCPQSRRKDRPRPGGGGAAGIRERRVSGRGGTRRPGWS